MDRARHLTAYYKYKLLRESGPVDEDTLVDALTDLMHLAAEIGDRPGIVERAVRHCEYERDSDNADEDDGC